MEQVQIPESEEVADHERKQTAGAVAVRSELDQAWWDEYLANMPQSD